MTSAQKFFFQKIEKKIFKFLSFYYFFLMMTLIVKFSFFFKLALEKFRCSAFNFYRPRTSPLTMLIYNSCVSLNSESITRKRYKLEFDIILTLFAILPTNLFPHFETLLLFSCFISSKHEYLAFVNPSSKDQFAAFIYVSIKNMTFWLSYDYHFPYDIDDYSLKYNHFTFVRSMHVLNLTNIFIHKKAILIGIRCYN